MSKMEKMENFSECQKQCGAQMFKTTNVVSFFNNNSPVKLPDDADKENTKGVVTGDQKPTWNYGLDVLLSAANDPGAGFVEDKGGGILTTPENGMVVKNPIEIGNCDDFAAEAAACCVYDCGDEAAAVNSNRTSTDNLSYSSDNLYPEDLIFLDEDDDREGEMDDVSLNSDDCVYAYRGDGADFDFPLDPISGRTRGIVGNSMDDEMDFLEMDFEPDTLSEIENDGNSIGSDMATAALNDTLLMQRDTQQMAGRHSSTSLMPNLLGKNCIDAIAAPSATQKQRQLFCSPIEDMPSAPFRALQAQSLLGKNFGRMSLHLDQIKGENDTQDSIEANETEEEIQFERSGILSKNLLPNGSSSVGANSCTSHSDIVDFPTSTAHSLPNVLHTFGRDHKLVDETEVVVQNKTSPSKITGAKPKRLSTFSTSSSTSSKTSSKSRASLRSVIGPSYFNSSSFDERSVSCTEFRSTPAGPMTAEDSAAAAAALTTSANPLGNPQDFNEDSCLDCLEKEFLASTIGKELEPNNCPKCRRSRFGFFSNESQQQQQSRCRSGSPSFFADATRESSTFYEMSHNFLEVSRKNWSGSVGVKEQPRLNNGSLSLLAKQTKNFEYCMPKPKCPNDAQSLQYDSVKKCDNFVSGELLRNLLTDKEIITISTNDFNEESIKNALDQLHIVYNMELIKVYFDHKFSSDTNLSSNYANSKPVIKEFKDLKQFLLNESLKNCNYPEIKRLIEYATNYQVDIQFKEDNSKTATEFVNVNVADLLRFWTRNNNLETLKDLDKRFIKANVLGKIANIIRQTQSKRNLPHLRVHTESIAIPQYYKSGFLIIKKKNMKP